MRRFFITGTDTEVGKTEVSAAIVHILKQQGHHLRVRKPVATGCKRKEGQWHCEDTVALMGASGTTDVAEIVTPFAFADPLAPHLAARRAGTPITVQQLCDAALFDVQDGEFLVVEGAGGLYSPIAEDGLCADLAKRLDMEVVLVVGNRVGCINHAVLTSLAIEAEGLKLHSIILNDFQNNHTILKDNQSAIKQYTGFSPFTTPHLTDTRTRWPLMAGHLQKQSWKP